MNRQSKTPAARYGPGETNGFAIVSFVLGVVWLMGLGSILALVFGYVAKREIDTSDGIQGGRGFAVAGIVLGWMGVAVIILSVMFIATGLVAPPTMPMMRMIPG